MNRAPAIVALIIAAVALVVALDRRPKSEPPPGSAKVTDTPTISPGELDRWHRELATLRNELADLREKVSVPEAGSRGSQAAEELSEIRRRLGELEARQASLATQAAQMDRYGLIASMERELVDSYQTVLDETQPLKARLKEVDRLKKFGHFDERAVQSMLRALAGTDDLNEKSGVLQVLAGAVKTADFRDQVIVSLGTEIQSGNLSPRYRYHAIEALEPMLPDPLVQQWLTHLAQTDPEYKIANRAGEAVGIRVPPPPKTP